MSISRRKAASFALLASILLIAGSVAQHRVRGRVQPEAREMRTLINRARVADDETRVKLSPRLSRVALRHSREMAAQDNLHHNDLLVRDVGDLPWRILGENVGVGASVEGLHTAFMNSSPHRKNVLDRRFRLVGIGVRVAGERTWVTVVFYG